MVFNEYIINNEVIFDTNVNKLKPLGEHQTGPMNLQTVGIT